MVFVEMERLRRGDAVVKVVRNGRYCFTQWLCHLRLTRQQDCDHRIIGV